MTSLALVSLGALLGACSEAQPKDRSAEAAQVCEAAVRDRVAAPKLAFESEVTRQGSGGWIVEGTLQGSDGSKTYGCGVFAEGDADTGALVVDGVNRGEPLAVPEPVKVARAGTHEGQLGARPPDGQASRSLRSRDQGRGC
jgi:hypothetical protein